MKHIIYISVILFVVTGHICSAADENIQQLKKRIQPALALSIEELQLALSIKVHEKYDGASIVADNDERTFLGKINSSISSDSIFNNICQYGSDISSNSIWNDIGRFCSDISSLSPFNEISSSPPFIVKNNKVIGRLTVNTILVGAVDPNWLKSYYK